MATKKAQVLITANASQATQALQDLQRLALLLADDIKDATAQMQAFVKAGDTANAKAMQKNIDGMTNRMNAYTTAVDKHIEKTKKLGEVVADLSNSKLRELKAAMGQGKSMLQGLKGSDDDLRKARGIQQMMKQVGDQIRLIEGEYVKMGEVIANVGNVSDNTLNKAIKQQKDLVANIERGTAEYNTQMTTLRKLEAEEDARKGKMGISQAQFTAYDKNATASDLRRAKTSITEARDNTSTADTAKIKDYNDALANIEKRLDEVNNKTKTAAISWQKMRQVLASPSNATGEDIKKTMDAIQQKIAQLPAGGKRVAYLREQFKQLEQVLKGTQSQIVDVTTVLNKMAAGKASLGELKAAYKQLEQELQSLETKSQSFIDKQKQMKDIKKQIDDATGAVHKQSSAWQTALRNLTAYVGLFAVFNHVKQYFTDLFKLNMQFSDQLVNIRKVSGLAMTDIERLSNTLSKIDTRTTVQELNNIAYAGAKLGIGDYGVAALEGFTRAANQVNVALKEDLGEEALTALSKITEVMGLIPQLGVEESMLKTGSAIFKLASTSTATSGKIIDFSNRLLAMGKEGALSTADILALGAAVDAMALEPEVASTAFNKMIVEIRKGTSSLEKDLGIAEGRLKSLVEQGKGMEAIQTIFHAMAGKDNVFALENLFGDLGSEGGARMVKTMVTMANSVGMLDKAVRTANVAFDEGSAVTMEYNMQQETAAAYMERAANLWEKQFINATNANGPIKEIAQSWYEMTQSLLGAGEATGGFTLALDTLVATVKLGINLIPLFVSFLMTKGIGAAVTALTPMVSTFCSTAYAGFQSLIGAIKAGAVATGGFTAKWKAMDAAMKSNVIGLLVGLTVQLVYWWSQYESELTSVEKAQKKVNEVHEQAVNNIQAEVVKLESLNKMAHDQNVLLEDRKKAIDILNETIPEYNGQLDETTGKYKANEEALKKYNDQLLRNAEIEGAKSAIADLSGQLANAKGRRFKIQQELENTPEPTAGGNNSVLSYSNSQYLYQSGAKIGVQNRLKDATKEVEDIQAELNALKDLYADEIAKSYVKVTPDKKKTGDGTTTSGKTTSGKTNNESSIAKNRANALIANIKAFYEEQQRKYLLWVAEMNKDGEKVSEGEVELFISKLTEKKDTALGLARQSIATAGEELDEFRKQLSGDIYGTATDTDKRLLNDIENADIKELHALFSKLSGDLSKENHKTLSENLGALLDEIFKNGSEDLRKAAELVVKRQRDLQKMLAEMDYTGTIQRETRSNLDRNALLPAANGIDPNSTSGVQDMSSAFDALTKKVRESWTSMYEFDVRTQQGRDSFLAYLSDPEITAGFDFQKLNIAELQALWMELIKYPENYSNAEKQAADKRKKVNDYDWSQTPYSKAYNNALPVAEQDAAVNGSYRNAGEKLGMSDITTDDPELKLLKMRMEYAREYYDFIEKHNATEQQLADARNNIMKSQAEYAKKLTSDLFEQYNSLLSFMSPLQSFGESMGEAFGTMRSDADAGKKAIMAAVKQMVKSFATQTIQLISNQQIEKAQTTAHYTALLAMRQAYDQAMIGFLMASGQQALAIQMVNNQKEVNLESIKTQQKTALRSAGIFGWCVSELGPIAGPIAYSAMMATLMGLLNYALSFIGGGSSSNNSASTNTKLVSGMLTYDEGNLSSLPINGRAGGGSVNQYVGTDGRVYAARDAGALPAGVSIVEQPIATTVNGQPALVGERGPEIVIGRETTANIIHNAPYLISMLSQYDRNRSVRRVYDEGNVSDMSTSLPSPNNGEGQGIGSLNNTLASLTSVLSEMQKNGVRAHINKYGKGGLVDEVQSGLAFMRKHG